MELRPSPKTFENYRCDHPQNTIARIREGFRRLDLEVTYRPTVSRQLMAKTMPLPTLGVFSGHAQLKGMPPQMGTNGKGVTADLAAASALAELVERYAFGVLQSYYSAYVLQQRLITRAEFDRLASTAFLPGFCKGHQSKIRNAVRVEEFLVGENFPPRDVQTLARMPVAQQWVDAWDVTARRTVKVPISFASRLCGSNGIASGNTLEEAIAHGTCEVFERFATWEVIRKRIECPTVPVRSIQDREILAFIKAFQDAGIHVTIKDLSLGGRFPCVGVVFRNENLKKIKDSSGKPRRDHFYRTLKVGAHPRRKDALLRCFTEEVQGLDEKEYRFRGSTAEMWKCWIDVLKRPYELPPDAWSTATGLGRADYLRHGDVAFLEKGPQVPFTELADVDNHDCLDDVALVADICRREGTRLCVVDTTHPVLGFPSIVVIVPGISNVNNLYENFKASWFASDRKRWPRLAQRLDLERWEESDDWLGDRKATIELLDTVEAYLSRFLGNFNHDLACRLLPIDLMFLMAFGSIHVGRYREACDYLELVKRRPDLPADVQPALEQFGDLLKVHLLGEKASCECCKDSKPDPERVFEHLRERQPTERLLVADPPVNPFRSLWDAPGLSPYEQQVQPRLQQLYKTFLASVSRRRRAAGG